MAKKVTPKTKEETKPVETVTESAPTSQNALVPAQSNLPAAYSSLMDDMPVESSDLILSKLLAMQGLSKLIQEERAKLGDIRDSVTGGLIATKTEPVEVILFKPFKTWVVFQVVDNKEKFKSVEQYTPDMVGLPKEEVIDGTKIVRYLCLNYYTLLTSEIKTGDYRPRLISLRSTNYKVGKKVETIRAFLSKAGLPLPFKTINLFTSQQNNEKGTWYTFDVTEGRKTTEDELNAVKEWIDIIGASNVVVDNSDLESERDLGHSSGEVRASDKF